MQIDVNPRGIVEMNISVSLRAIRDFYDKVAVYYDYLMHGNDWSALNSGSYSPWYVDVLRNAGGRGRIIDCGCGTGFHLAVLKELGYQADGLDISKIMLDHAVNNLRMAPEETNARFHEADMSQLHCVFAPGYYDMVFCLGSTLLHLDDSKMLRFTIEGFANTLSPGGLCLLEFDDLSSMMEPGEAQTRLFHIEQYAEHIDASVLGIDFWTLTSDHLVSELLILKPNQPTINAERHRLRLACFKPEEVSRLLSASGFRIIRRSHVEEPTVNLYNTLFNVGDGRLHKRSTCLIVAQKE